MDQFIIGPPINLLDLDPAVARAILGDAVYEEAMKMRRAGPKYGTMTVTRSVPAAEWVTMVDPDDDND